MLMARSVARGRGGLGVGVEQLFSVGGAVARARRVVAGLGVARLGVGYDIWCRTRGVLGAGSASDARGAKLGSAWRPVRARERGKEERGERS
jgi:hypothetical protein